MTAQVLIQHAEVYFELMVTGSVHSEGQCLMQDAPA